MTEVGRFIVRPDSIGSPSRTSVSLTWHVPMQYQSQRPVAWGQGTESGCSYVDEELWTSGTNNNGFIDIFVLDGDDGSTKEMIQVPTNGNGLVASFYGIYGGAVDGNGDFWGSQLGNGSRLIRVNRDDMTWQTWSTPPGPHWYGMTVDSEG